MSAALRRAIATLSTETSIGDRLVSVGIAPRDAEAAFDALHEHYGNDLSIVRIILTAAHDAGRDGADEDALPLLEALRALPEGQQSTLSALWAGIAALAAAEGLAVGAHYLANTAEGQAQRRRTRPKR